MTETTKDLEHRTERFVRINDRFAISREKKPGIHCWILREFYTGYKRGKTADEKIPTRKVKQTYYATLEQACMMVIEKSADGETAQAMIDAIHEATKEVVAAIDRHEVAEALDRLVFAAELPGDHCEIEQALPAAHAALKKYREMYP